MSRADACRSRVLLFGHELGLLSSRKWLLLKLDCDCTTSSTLADYRQQVMDGGLDLIILCQTASYDECALTTAFAAEHSSSTPLLIMFSRHVRCEPEQDYVLLDAMAGPGAFLQAAGQLLTQASPQAASTA